MDKHLHLLHLICLFLVFLLKCCNGFSLKPTRPMCDGRPFASSPFCSLASRGAFFCGFLLRWVLHLLLSLSRSFILHDAASCSREGSLYECECTGEALSCLFFSALWLQSIQSIVVQEAQSAKDIDLTCFQTFPIKTATCLQVGPVSFDWPVDPFAKYDFQDLRLLLMFPATNNNEAIFQLPNVPVGDRMLSKHYRRYYSILQDGMDVAPSFPKVCDVSPGTPGVSLDRSFPSRRTEFKFKYLKKLFAANNILCLQEVHGKDEYLQAVQVLAPQFRFFGTFIPDNENAGGSAICIHRDPSEKVIVTHLITCHGRDHLVNIQSGRHNFVP